MARRMLKDREGMPLTDLEKTVLHDLSIGLSYQELADARGWKVSTAHSRAQAGQHKLGATHVPHAIAVAIRLGVIP